MSKKMASIVITYGVTLAGLGFLIKSLTPELARVPFLTGLIGGGLCLVWGVAGWLGLRRRSGVILTLIAIALLILGQAIPAWIAGEGTTAIARPLLLTLIMSLTVGMLMYLLHGERPPEFYRIEPSHRDKTSSRP